MEAEKDVGKQGSHKPKKDKTGNGTDITATGNHDHIKIIQIAEASAGTVTT